MYIYAENNDWKDLDENILAGDGIMGNVFLFFYVFFKKYLLSFKS